MQRALSAVLLSSFAAGCSRPADPAPQVIQARPEKVYRNPVDGKVYEAPGGWDVYDPQKPRPVDPSKKVRAEGVRLLTPQDDVFARTTVEALAAFFRSAEDTAASTLGASPKPFKAFVQFTCTPQESAVRISTTGEFPQAAMQAFYDALRSAEKLPVSEGEVVFLMEISVLP